MLTFFNYNLNNIMNMDRFITIKCILPTDRNNMYLLISDYYRFNAYCTQHTNWKKLQFTGTLIF